MNKIYFLRYYNNYYNRKFKPAPNIDAGSFELGKVKFADSGYGDYAINIVTNPNNIGTNDQENAVYQFENEFPVTQNNLSLNFDEGDGVNAKIIIPANTLFYNPATSYNQRNSYASLAEGLDYIVVCSTDDSEYIYSRWFVLENKIIRGGIREITLYRDVIQDNYNTILDANCYIEKATIKDPTNPLIYNNEGLNVNQIKTSETLLKDYTGCSWIVGYYDKSQRSNLNNITVAFENSGIEYESVAGISTWTYYQYNSTNPYKYLNSWFYMIGEQSGLHETCYSKFNKNGTFTGKLYKNIYNLNHGVTASLNLISEAISNNQTNLDSAIRSDFGGSDLITAQNILSYQGKYLLDTVNSKYYQVIIHNDNEVNNFSTCGNNLWDELLDTIKPDGVFIGNITGPIWNDTFKCGYNLQKIYVQLVDVTEELGATINFNITDPIDTQDAPYNIFCIPVPDEGQRWKYILSDGSTVSEIFTKQTALAVAQSIAYQKGVGSNAPIYDIQWLPYCPIKNIYIGDGIGYDKFISLYQSNELSVVHVKNSESYFIPIFEVKFSQFTGDINKSISCPNRTDDEALNLKLSNEVDLYRITSPNFASQFEFSLAKNNGVNTFNYDCTYKPYSPYIHVNPNFKGLYGNDFNDPRGLILSGDFSLPIITNSFTTYEYQNKNYEKIFNRQIENLDFNSKISNIQNSWSNISGIISGVGSGATSALFASGGNPLIGAAGAVAGGLVSAYGGVKDKEIYQQQQRESKQYTIDMYNYNLANIKAMPNTLTKVGAFNSNYKIYPLIEYYTCTDAELDALKNKLYFNGMTVMVIDKIKNYIQNDYSYIKAYIINIGTTSDSPLDMDYHMAEAIGNELQKGVMIK